MEGTLPLGDLKEKVQIRWSPHAVPHILAANEQDLFMAQGYLHAQERLWQMDMNRRLLCGRLTEIVGPKPAPWKALSARFRDKTTLDLDYFVRLMGIRRAACASLKLLPEEFVERLLAYGKGVNRYIESHLKRLPLEFRLLRYEPDPWQPEDSLTIGKGFALFLSTALLTRLAMSAITEKLKGQEAKLKVLFPAYPEEGPTITRSAAQEAQELLRFLNGTFGEAGLMGGGHGSNSWVVAPPRSSTGRAILCNDPHLRLMLPSVWYLMHLQAARADNDAVFDVWGASVPGSPCIYLGHNRWITWGVTAALCDDADLYLEKIHPQNPDLYLAGSDWTEMNREDEKILIRGGREVGKAVRFSRHGPILSDFTGIDSAGEVLALKWTAHEPSQEFRALYGVNRARDWDEFLNSLSYQDAPTLNYVYADVQGNIGYTLAGKIPIRPQSRSFLPLPGWSTDFDWKGYVPFRELPHLYNPREGIIATANQRIADTSYPYYLSDLFEPPYRISRIKELLTSKDRFSLADMVAIQHDALSLQARETIQELRPDLEQIACKSGSLRDAIQRLLMWDGSCLAQSIEATLYHVFLQRLMENLWKPDLGEELFLAYVELLNQFFLPLKEILRDPRSPWFASSSRQSLVEKSLSEALEDLKQRLGPNPDDWQWGRLHTLTLGHPLGEVKILAPLLSIGPLPSPGDSVTINMGYYRYSSPYEHTVGPSLRMVIDVGNWEASRFVVSPGQSGHPFSPYYRDQVDLWRSGEYMQLYLNEERMKNSPALLLTPAGK